MPATAKAEGVVFAKPAEAVRKAAADALAASGFEIKKADPLYVEGFRPRRIGALVASGGETLGIWLEPMGAGRTRVRVDTARSFVEIVGQKRWDSEVLAEMERVLGKRE